MKSWSIDEMRKMSDIIVVTISELTKFADEMGRDRDDVILFSANYFKTIAEISSFEKLDINESDKHEHQAQPR